MLFGGFPATKSTGFATSVPVAGGFIAPGKGVGPFGKGGFGGFGGFGLGKPFGIGGIGGFGLGKPFGIGGFGFPATKAAGFGSKVPATTVATTPFGFI
jgi:hypothetical protein